VSGVVLKSLGRPLMSIADFPASWWWIAIRITAIVEILRNRHIEGMRGQVVILSIGLGVEAILLLLILSVRILYKFYGNNVVSRNVKIWDSHSVVYYAMAVCWIMVVLCGLVDDVPNIFFPCSGSTSGWCSILTKSL
jgi:hypothetical protein